MTTVSDAIEQGWKLVEEHLQIDYNVALMMHKRDDGLWEYGFAVWKQTA